MPKPELRPTRCAVCGGEGNADEVYPARLDWQAFTARTFSARRVPDGLHYRMVRCRTCGLVRSDPAASVESMTELYAAGTFDYAAETAELSRTYGRYLALVRPGNEPRGGLLEIGCGNGFLLQEARRQGYEPVRGVEPGQAAVRAAAEDIRPDIVCDMMRPGLFEAGQFDVVCMFQLLDHIADPGSLLEECRRVLRPGGRLLVLNHNVNSFSSRLMGERSPIVDVEHTYLFAPDTLSRLLDSRGFRVVRAGRVYNRYALRYVVRLAPLPPAIKRLLAALTGRTFVGAARLWLPLGNLYAVAERTTGDKGASPQRHRGHRE